MIDIPLDIIGFKRIKNEFNTFNNYIRYDNSELSYDLNQQNLLVIYYKSENPLVYIKFKRYYLEYLDSILYFNTKTDLTQYLFNLNKKFKYIISFGVFNKCEINSILIPLPYKSNEILFCCVFKNTTKIIYGMSGIVTIKENKINFDGYNQKTFNSIDNLIEILHIEFPIFNVLKRNIKLNKLLLI